MPAERDWRTAVDTAGEKPLRYMDIAFGYLSRNPRYRARFDRAMRDVGRGRLSSGAAASALIRQWGVTMEPVADRQSRRVIAHPALSPASIILAKPPDLLPATSIDIEALGDIRSDLMVGDAMHIGVPDPQGDLSLWLFTRPGRSMAVVLPFGEGLNARYAEAERLRRRLRGIGAGLPSLIVPPSRRAYFRMLFRVLDGRQAGARSRELAAVLIDPDVRQYSAAEWSDSAERRQIGRWTASAFELMNGGYLRLLRGA